ncbi:MAG: glycosyltransferase [candidate division KSB1 bacterium]|nr:glycosyltransferase [candidate division KSB1 bacterium]
MLPKQLKGHHRRIRHYDPGDVAIPFMINTEGNSAFRRHLYIKMGGMNPLLFGHEGQELSFKLAQAFGVEAVIYWPETVIYHDYFDSNTASDIKRARHRLMNEYIERICPGIKTYRKKIKKQLGKHPDQPNPAAALRKRAAHAAAYVHSGSWPSPSPSSTFVIYNAAALARVLDSCYLFVQAGSREPVDRICQQDFNMQVPDGLHIISIRTVLSSLTKKLLYQNYKRHICELANQGLVSAMITRRETLLPVLFPIQEKYKIPLLYETHDFYADLSVRDDIDPGKSRQQTLEREYIPRISGVIGLQSPQLDWYRRYFPQQRFFLARTGLIHRYEPVDSGKYVTYLGSWEPHKGVEIFLNALAQLKPCPPVLFVGGKTEKEVQQFRERVSRYIPLSGVKITGWVGKQQLGAWMRQTAIGVLPLMPTFFNRYLTSPLKLFDYYSYSIPVVASDLPTTRDLIVENETGVFFDPGNSEQLAERIRALLEDREHLESMRRHVYEYAKQFMWAKRAEILSDIIHKVQIL